VECGVWSVECGVWSVECGVWSVECGVKDGIVFAAARNDGGFSGLSGLGIRISELGVMIIEKTG